MRKLKKNSQFQKVYKKGEAFKGSNIRLYVLANELRHNRVGISIPSRKVPLSVNRNRSKRLLSESHRISEDLLKDGYDIVLTAERDLSRTGFHAVKEAVLKLYKKCRILK